MPLDKRTWFVPEVLDGMEHLSLVCIDNIECVAGDELWEMAIFDLYNRILESGKTRLLITGDRPPRQLKLGLPDLASRLDWGQIYKLQPLSDEDKLQALQLRARLRGFELPEDVGRFLLKRLDREMRSLFMTLDQLAISSSKCSTSSGIGLPDATLLPFSRHSAVPLMSRCAHGISDGQK